MPLPQVPTRKALLTGLKAKPAAQRLKRWVWKAFTSSARKDNAALSHWVRADAEFTDYPFARFNKRADIIRYTDAEYAELCTPAPDRTDAKDDDVRWPKDHTDLLFDLCRRYDLRWPLIYDRFTAVPAHSLEDMKQRFYTVTARVITHRLKNKDEAMRSMLPQFKQYESFSYRSETEQKRRRALDSVFRRSNEAIHSERELLKELRAIQTQIQKLGSKAGGSKAARAAAPSPLAAAADDVAAGAGGGYRKKVAITGVATAAGAYPPLFPTAAALTVANLAVKKHAPVVPTASPSGDAPTDFDAIRAFATPVALRSAQLAAPLEGHSTTSKSDDRARRVMREHLNVPERPLPSVQVFAAHRQLRRETEYMLSLARMVEAEEQMLHKLIAQRRDAALKPLQTGKVVASSGQLAKQAAISAAAAAAAATAAPAAPGTSSGASAARPGAPGTATADATAAGRPATGAGTRGGMPPPPPAPSTSGAPGTTQWTGGAPGAGGRAAAGAVDTAVAGRKRKAGDEGSAPGGGVAAGAGTSAAKRNRVGE